MEERDAALWGGGDGLGGGATLPVVTPTTPSDPYGVPCLTCCLSLFSRAFQDLGL